jgi:HD domain-containing protein
MQVHVAGIPIPDSEMAQHALAVAREGLPDVLIGHALRVFLFSALIGRRRGIAFSDELLFIAAALHHYGLSPRYQTSQRRFELDSADAALELLRSYKVAARTSLDVWDAIALHTTFGLAGFEAPLIGLLLAGIETDLMAWHFDEISLANRIEVVRAYPRGPIFKSSLIEALSAGMLGRPATTFGTVNADVLDRQNPDFCRINFCGLIFGSAWED